MWAGAANATPSGKLTRECWETIRDMIVDAARKAGKLDGICLSLHGAMVTETEDDAEGALLELLRGVVGPDVPIATTLDLHANATRRMAKNANALVSYRTYPHIDGYERAVQAAALVQEAMDGQEEAALPAGAAGHAGRRRARPHHPARPDARPSGQGRYLREGAGHRRGQHPGRLHLGGHSLYRPLGGGEHEPAAEARAKAIARELIDEIWRRRDEGAATYYRPIADGIAAARAGVGKQGPLVIADGTDNPGGGGYNDTTPVLKALLDAGIENVAFGTIYDPAAVQQATKAGVGSEIEVSLGGHTDAAMGAPVKAKAIVKMLSDGSFKNDGPMNAGVETSMGPTAVLRIGGIDVVTISSRIQTIDLQVFLSQGIDPTAKSVLVVKSVQHYRAAYAPIAREIVLVDSGGICSPDISRLKFTKLRRPIWPLDGVNDPYAGTAASG